jgi:NAD(P)-dependent dehydrogenase (short-subunit alcohol dehydrogenase family)
MERIFITGANRGIGFGIVQKYLERGNARIFAACRNPDQANELRQLAENHPEAVTIIQLDLSDNSSIDAAFAQVNEHIDGLDVLINNAAMRFPDEQELFGAIKADEFLHSMHVNAVSPFMIVQTFVDLLKAGNNPRIVNVTTGTLVPVEYNLPYNYCISKAALNMITRYFAVNLAEFGIISIGLYPGWVQTEMGLSGGGDPPLTIEESGKGIVEVISDLTMVNNEQFIAWNGRILSALYW